MAKIITHKRKCVIFDDQLDPEEFGAETEAEKQMKVILEKQLNTKTSMKDQFSQHRVFVAPSTCKPLTDLVQGVCSAEKFIEIESSEELHQELQRCGLSEKEITDYLAFKSGKEEERRLRNPSVWEESIRRIEEKIKAHGEDMHKPQSFKGVKKLTRHEMELERTLYAGCSEKSKLAALVAEEEGCDKSYTNGAFTYIKSLSDKLLEKCKKKRKRQKVTECDKLTSPETTKDFQFDSNIHHVVVPMESSEVEGRRLTLEEIRKLPKFENYRMGDPNKTLYIKNLHPKITVQELRALFGTFEEENSSPIDYKLCTGRMKGQAFVKFSDLKIAEKALHFANGYVLRGRPTIIEFGRKT